MANGKLRTANECVISASAPVDFSTTTGKLAATGTAAHYALPVAGAWYYVSAYGTAVHILEGADGVAPSTTTSASIIPDGGVIQSIYLNGPYIGYITDGGDTAVLTVKLHDRGLF
jgi:hypothetical protein